MLTGWMARAVSAGVTRNRGRATRGTPMDDTAATKTRSASGSRTPQETHELSQEDLAAVVEALTGRPAGVPEPTQAPKRRRSPRKKT